MWLIFVGCLVDDDGAVVGVAGVSGVAAVVVAATTVLLCPFGHELVGGRLALGVFTIVSVVL